MSNEPKDPPNELVDKRLRAIWSAREVVVTAAREVADALQAGGVPDVAVLIAALTQLDTVSDWSEPVPPSPDEAH
jgi:hypothetical protein